MFEKEAEGTKAMHGQEKKRHQVDESRDREVGKSEKKFFSQSNITSIET